MSQSSAFSARIAKEQKMFTYNPPPGVCVYSIDNSLTNYHAEITGPEDSPYENGVFELELTLSNRYPFEPPKLQFITPIYHPNIDSTGRICLDLLKMPPAGNWQPSLNICVLLTSLRLLLSSPNPLDPLMVDISEEYLKNNELFVKKAREQTEKYAMKKSIKRQEERISKTEEQEKHVEVSNEDTKKKQEEEEEVKEEEEEEDKKVKKEIDEKESEEVSSSESSEASWSD